MNDLLDLAKIEAGKIEVRPTVFDVNSLFSALRGMLRPLLVTPTVELLFEEPSDLPPLHTDESKVSQILRNFLSNALKFTERGEVRVSANLSTDRKAIIFAVTDTGIGIAPEDQEQIFVEFAQVEHPLQKRTKGTGLGLPLCRKLADLLGGSISVESTPGIGSTFCATIPLVYRYAQSNTKEEVSVSHDPTKPVVLVVEDNEELLFVYQRYLAGTAFGFVAARSLREARRHLDHLRPHAILLDILLPNESAWSFLAELKNHPETATLPVLVVTTEEDQQKGLALGADAYGIKPVSRAWLLDQLARLAPMPTERLLLIEDQAEMRYLFQKLLANTSYHLLESTNGVEGLTRAQTEQPDLICLDLMLPGMDGFSVLAQIKADARTQHIPVLIVTAKQLNDDEHRQLTRQAPIFSKADLTRPALLAALQQARTQSTVKGGEIVDSGA